MLYIDFGHPLELAKKYNNFVYSPNIYFDNTFRPAWLEDPLVKQMVIDIDKSEVQSPYCIMSPVLGQIPPERLSGGVKALILMLQDDDDVIMWATSCGNNCAKWILEIAKSKDLTVVFSHVMHFGNAEDEMEALILNTNKQVHNVKEFVLEAVMLC